MQLDVRPGGRGLGGLRGRLEGRHPFRLLRLRLALLLFAGRGGDGIERGRYLPRV